MKYPKHQFKVGDILRIRGKFFNGYAHHWMSNAKITKKTLFVVEFIKYAGNSEGRDLIITDVYNGLLDEAYFELVTSLDNKDDSTELKKITNL